MKTMLAVLFMFISGAAFANEGCNVCPPKKPKPQVVTIVKTVEVDKKCGCQVPGSKQDTDQDTKSTSGSKSASANKVTTGNQTITINMPPRQPAVKIIRKTIIKTKIKKVVKEVTNPNRLQLLVGQSRTRMNIQQDACGCTLTANRQYQPDFGAQYLRDFGGFTGSIAGTTQQSWYVGVGFNW